MNRQTLGVKDGPAGAWAVGWRAVVGLFGDVVGAVVPATCRLCDAPMDHLGGAPVCLLCLHASATSAPVGCSRCGEAAELAIDFEDVLFARTMAEQIVCRECRLAPPAYARAVSYGTYEAELRGLIGLFKFNRVRGLAKVLGPRLAEAVLKLEGVAGPELLVVAVPLYAGKARERGFNQAELLAAEALVVLRGLRPGWKLTAAHAVLERQLSTESSFALSRQGRRRNLAGAFRISGDVRGREVLLIDDILTTGATARECARVLRRAGASRVFVATLARSQRGSVRQQYEQAEEVARWDLPATTGSIHQAGRGGQDARSEGEEAESFGEPARGSWAGVFAATGGDQSAGRRVSTAGDADAGAGAECEL